MFDFENISGYKENNRLEVKRSESALPRSLWETYSAFSNSLGGVILLGVAEKPDKTFDFVGVQNADKITQDFWNGVNNKQLVNTNILSDRNVQTIEIKGKRIISIEVPRASRQNKPVYMGNNPFTGSFEKAPQKITISNPGSMRLSIDEAISGGISDPRSFDVSANSNEGYVYGDKDNMGGDIGGDISQKQIIIDFLLENKSGRSSDFMRLLNLRSQRVRNILNQLMGEGILVAEGKNKGRVYKLK